MVFLSFITQKLKSLLVINKQDVYNFCIVKKYIIECCYLRIVNSIEFITVFFKNYFSL